MPITGFDPEEYWEDRLQRRLTLHGVGDPRLGRRYNEWLYKLRHRVFVRELKRLGRDLTQMDVLDVGSGTGFYVELWRELGARSVHATDLTTAAVSALERRFPDVACSKLDIGARLPDELRHEQVDLVSAMDVLFHIVDDRRYRRAFQNMHDVLRPGGLLVFSENFVRHQDLRGRQWANRSFDDIARILGELDFRTISHVPMFVLMNTPVDTGSRFHRAAWQAATWPLKRSEPAGNALGALLYPLDVRLTAHAHAGPSTEMVICETPR